MQKKYESLLSRLVREDEDPTEAKVCFLTIKSEIDQILDTFGGSKSGFRTRQRHRVRYWALIGAIEGIRDHMNALLNSWEEFTDADSAQRGDPPEQLDDQVDAGGGDPSEQLDDQVDAGE